MVFFKKIELSKLGCTYLLELFVFSSNIVILILREMRRGITVWIGFVFVGLQEWPKLIQRHTSMDQPLILTRKRMLLIHHARHPENERKVETREAILSLRSQKQKQKYCSNLTNKEIWPTKFYYKESMANLGVDDGLARLFQRMEWDKFLKLFDRTFKEPTLEFLSTFAKDNEAKILTFQLQGLSHRLTYK